MKRYKNLSRPKKAALNLALAVVLLFALWAYFDYPLPTTEMEFRRLERQNMLPKSEIVFLSEKEDATFVPLEGPELVLSGRWAVGLLEENAVMAYLGDYYPWGIWQIPLKTDGPTVIPLACQHIWGNVYGYWVEEGPIPAEEGGGYRYAHHNFTPMLLLNVPEGTVRTEFATPNDVGKVRVGEGWNLGDGVWLVSLMHGEYERNRPYDGCPYALRLYDASGDLILEQEGAIPQI